MRSMTIYTAGTLFFYFLQLSKIKQTTENYSMCYLAPLGVRMKDSIKSENIRGTAQVETKFERQG